jgi:hypothetical protein
MKLCEYGPTFFITYEYAFKLECFTIASPSSLVLCNSLAYWTNS